MNITHPGPTTAANPARPGVPQAIPGQQAESVRLLNYPAWLYHASLERQSCSLLKPLLQSPAHYRAQFFQSRSGTAAMDFGSLIHLLVLEPGRFHMEYAILPPEIKAATAAGRAFAKKNAGRKLLTELELHDARRMAQRVLERPYKGRPFGRFVEEGEPEVTIFFNDPVTDTPCRVRLDLWHPDILFDLKTTRQNSTEGFVRSSVELHYDLQAYMYALADFLHRGSAQPKPFVFMAAQSANPCTVSALTAGSTFMENGRAKYERCTALYKACRELDYWPDDGAEEDIEISPWQAFRVPQAAIGGCA